MAVDNWHLNFQPAKSDGTLPLEAKARSFRFQREIIWQVDVLTLGIAPRKGRGTFVVEITNPFGRVWFRSKITIEVLLVSLNVGVLFFTWSYTKDEFETTVVGGVETTKETIGKFVQGGTALSEQGIAIPGGGSDFGVLVALVMFKWQSPIWLFDEGEGPLPPGSKVKITRDEWGFGPASVEYSWAFDEATATPVGTVIDGLDSLVVGNSGVGIGREGSGRVHIARSWPLDDFTQLELLCPVKGDYPTFHELDDGRLICSVLAVEGVVEYVTQTSGFNWERVKYVLPDSATPKEAPIFSPGIDMPVSLMLDENTRLHVGVRRGKLAYSLVDEEGPSEEQIIGAVPDSDTSLPSLERAPDGTINIIGGKGIPIYRTVTIPPRWERVNGGLT